MPVFNGSGIINESDPTVTITVSQFWLNVLGAADEATARDRLGFPNYQILSEKDQANGYAALNAQRQLDPARIPSAPRWTNARILTLAGDATGSVAWDGSANATLTVDVPGLDSLQGGQSGGVQVRAAVSFRAPEMTIFRQSNIASIVRESIATYRINFLSPLEDATYLSAGAGWHQPGAYVSMFYINEKHEDHFRLIVTNQGGTPIDSLMIDVLIFR